LRAEAQCLNLVQPSGDAGRCRDADDERKQAAGWNT
jgi:hypothetical protein